MKRGIGVTNRVEADLHCHTTCSDGTLTPRELIRSAKTLGLLAIGITDHDTVSGWDEAADAGKEFSVEILRGIELNTDWNGTKARGHTSSERSLTSGSEECPHQEVHILGYELDPGSACLHEYLRKLRLAREKRMLLMLDKLRGIGIGIDLEEVRKMTTGRVIGRPHLAQVLVQRGFSPSIKDAFQRFIGTGAPAYVPRYKLSTEEGIRLIRDAGGVAVLAHPGIQGLEAEIPAWVESGLQGLEVYHSEHSPDDERRYRKIAQKFNLLMTGGSDFHGEKIKPGVRLGGWGVALEVVKQIKDMSGR